MPKFKCVNRFSCDYADMQEVFDLPAGETKCPKCRSEAKLYEETDPVPVPTNKWVLIAVVVGILVIAGVGYMKWNSSRVVTLKPDSSSTAVVPEPSAIEKPEPTAAEKPAPMVANEVAAQKSCDEAIKAKQTNADNVCRHATAVSLMNSGVLFAIDGKLDQAEKDYLAARDKDPDFPELYFNLAVLKARQNKGSEAVDNLTLASSKGFTQFSAIKKEPAIQKLKSNPELKSKIEAFEVK